MTLNIDLTDPRVRGMLGQPSALTARPELVQIAGDAPDPTGLSDNRGMLSTTNLATGKIEVMVIYGDVLMTVDVYQVPGEPLKIHLLCPRCRKCSTVSGDHKGISFEPNEPNPQHAALVAMGAAPPVAAVHMGRLSIETFECAWEMGDAPHVAGGVHTGAALCRLRLAIDGNRAKGA